jgi:hypothetical protein
VTPAEFIRARLDEREAEAPSEHDMDWPACDAAWPDAYPDAECTCHLAQRRARVLREVTALRAMVDKDEGAASEYGDGSELSGYGDTGYTVWRAHFTMCTLAAIWSDHPDYDPAWQPTP